MPRPVRYPIPILIGGGGERVTLRIAARYADMWHSFGDPDTIRHKIAVLDDWCVKVGRDPAQIEHAISPYGPADADLFDAYMRAGATHIILGVSYGNTGDEDPWNFRGIEQLIQWRDARRV